METQVAIVGTGMMGEAHTNALRTNGIQVRGVLGSSEEKSQKFAEEYKLPKYYHSLNSTPVCINIIVNFLFYCFNIGINGIAFI